MQNDVRARRRGAAAIAVFALASVAIGAVAAEPKDAKDRRAKWLGDELPLPLVVRTPQDLAFKAVTEREYLVFNLLASGKLAWDDGRYAEAAEQWETLLGLPELDPAIDRVVRPLAIDARAKAGQVSTLPPAPPAPEPPPEEKKEEPKKKERTAFDFSGSITGGGASGPGGAVVSLRRADGRTPKPAAGTYVMAQAGKRFLPHVLAVPAGATVSFRNDDAIFHNVFSLSAPNDFDLGLYKAGLARTKTFEKPGAVQLFCNIHAAMNAWIVVLDTPWYAVADAAGRFTVRNVPAGGYAAEVWHEAASQPTRATVTVGPGLAPASYAVGGDRRAPQFPPDKSGKARQVQLGY